MIGINFLKVYIYVNKVTLLIFDWNKFFENMYLC